MSQINICDYESEPRMGIQAMLIILDVVLVAYINNVLQWRMAVRT